MDEEAAEKASSLSQRAKPAGATSSHPPKTAPIKNSFLRRHLVLAAVNGLRRFACNHGGLVYVGSKIYIKFGNLRQLSEASAMMFVAQHTSIPVPKVYCAFTRKGRTYIAMQRIDGVSIGYGWLQRSAESKAGLLHQLRGMVDQMRSITVPVT